MKKKQFTAADSVYTAGTPVGGGTFTIAESDLGWQLDGALDSHSVYVSGLDSGTYTTKYIDPFGDTRDWRTTGLAEVNVTILEEVKPNTIVVVLATLGGSAAPKCGIVSSYKSRG